MKKIFLLTMMALLASIVFNFSPLMAAEANVDFENENNFDAYSAKVVMQLLMQE